MTEYGHFNIKKTKPFVFEFDSLIYLDAFRRLPYKRVEFIEGIHSLGFRDGNSHANKVVD